jgi:hypothetical protein
MNDRWTLRFSPAAAFAVAPLVLAMVLAAAAPAAGAEISSIAPEKLEEMLGAPDLIVVDVRSDGQRESSGKKIRSAITVQSNQLESWSKDMPTGGRIVLYCD